VGHQVAGHPRRAAAGRDQRLAGGDRDADLRPAAERVADGQRRPHSALGVVLTGVRHPEDGHHGAADGVLHHAAEAGDLGMHPLQVPLEHAGDVLRVTLARIAGRLVDLAEQHGDELALGRPRLDRPDRLAARQHLVAALGGLVAAVRGAEQLQHRVLGEDRLLQALQPQARLDAELVHQDAAGGPIGGQRVRLPARAVQREHELAVQVLAQRVGAHQRVQLADQLQVPAEDELRLDAHLQRGDTFLVDADQLRPGGPGGHDVGQHRAAPQRQRLVQQPQRRGRLAAERAAALLGEPAEAVQVELVRVELQQVPGVAGDQHAGRVGDPVAGLDRPAQRGDVVLQRLPHGGGRLLAPHGVDQLVGGDHLVRVQQELGQQYAVLDAAQPQRAAALARLERSQQQKVDRCGHRPSPPSGAWRGADRCLWASSTSAMSMAPAA
jgi:hypothetical protein